MDYACILILKLPYAKLYLLRKIFDSQLNIYYFAPLLKVIKLDIMYTYSNEMGYLLIFMEPSLVANILVSISINCIQGYDSYTLFLAIKIVKQMSN